MGSRWQVELTIGALMFKILLFRTKLAVVASGKSTVLNGDVRIGQKRRRWPMCHVRVTVAIVQQDYYCLAVSQNEGRDKLVFMYLTYDYAVAKTANLIT